ncbi:putative secreted salivary gland peptide [Ixodes scapularis]
MAQSMSDIFLSFQQYLETEQDLREEIRVVVRELEQTARGILTILQGIHQPDGLSKIPELCQKSKAAFANVKNQFQVLKSKVPENQYYRFHDHWRFVSQRLVFLAALTTYLESETLIQREEVAAMLGVVSPPSSSLLWSHSTSSCSKIPHFENNIAWHSCPCQKH